MLITFCNGSEWLEYLGASLPAQPIHKDLLNLWEWLESTLPSPDTVCATKTSNLEWLFCKYGDGHRLYLRKTLFRPSDQDFGEHIARLQEDTTILWKDFGEVSVEWLREPLFEERVYESEVGLTTKRTTLVWAPPCVLLVDPEKETLLSSSSTSL